MGLYGLPEGLPAGFYGFRDSSGLNLSQLAGSEVLPHGAR
jgi:hypothetical protein